MSYFLDCPSCGKTLSIYYDFMNIAKQALFNEKIKSEYKDYDPKNLQCKVGALPNLEEIYDALEIKKRCCRMRMTTITNLDKIYN